MGAVRLITLTCLICVLVGLPASSFAQFQQPNDGQPASVQRAYYQPLTRLPNRRHWRQVDNHETDQISLRQKGHPRPPAWLDRPSAAHERGRQFPSEPDSGQALDSSNFDFKSPILASPVSVRQYQDDPFGEQQARQSGAENRFGRKTAKSQQDDPFGEKQKPRPVKPVKPDDTPLPSQLPKEPTKSLPQRIPDSIVPFADPPPKDQDLQEPVLPPDAKFSPKPGESPELIPPGNSNPAPTQIERPTKPSIDPPPESLENLPPKTPAKPPTSPLPQPPVPDPPPRANQRDLIAVPPAVQPTEKTPRQPSIQEAIQPANPIMDAVPLPGNVYRPPSRKLPSIVQPEQVPSNRFAPEPAPYSYPPPPVPQPSYQPLYDPIPAVESQPAPREPQALYLESESTPRYFLPARRQPVLALPHCRQAVSPSERSCQVVDSQDCQSHGCEPSDPSFYFSFMGGWTGLRDLKAASSNGKFQTNDGSGFSFALGRRNGRNLRTEVNLSFHENEIDQYMAGTRSQRFTGELTSLAGMANAYWEFVEVPSGRFKPYLGMGLGFISIDSQIRDPSGQSMIALDMNNDSSFAYQWMTGLNYNAVGNLDVFAEYRFLGADDFRIETTGASSGRYSYKTDNVFLGFRWKF